MKKIFNKNQIRSLDSYTIENEPISSLDLMERAAHGFVAYYKKYWNDLQRHIYIFCGNGNNGGDGLAIARILYSENFLVHVFHVTCKKDKTSSDFQDNLQRLPTCIYTKINNIEEIPHITENGIIIDAIFGIGLSRKLVGINAEVIQYVNNLPNIKIAVDIPSGLPVDTVCDDNIIALNADYTYTFQQPKLNFMFPEYYQYVGKWIHIPINISSDGIAKEQTQYFLLENKDLKFPFSKRPKFCHKGSFGNLWIVGGSLGKIGAIILAAKAALRSGAGLVTCLTPQCGNVPLQSACFEAMWSSGEGVHFIENFDIPLNADVVLLGPGMGVNVNIKSLQEFLMKFNKPLVIDADMINTLSLHKNLLNYIPHFSIFTPHPKEFQRLVGNFTNSHHRIEKQIEFSKKYRCYVVYKGAHTTISDTEGNVYFNTTGNPGMATAGSGDVLAGIVASILAQEKNSLEATINAVLLHGMAGDKAMYKKGETSLIAKDIIDCIPKILNKKQTTHLKH